MNKSNRLEKYGNFTTDHQDQVFGELSIDGSKTNLYLRSDSIFQAHSSTIKGSLYNLKKATLIDCICSGTGTSSSRHETYYHAEVFPHFIAIGEHYLDPANKTIKSFTIEIDDAGALFYEHGTFSARSATQEQLISIIEILNPNSTTTIGEHPIIGYFSGKTEIFKESTSIGIITASHNPSYNFGSAKGAGINNHISLTTEIENLINFREMTERTLDLLAFLELIIGKPQKIRKLHIQNNSDENYEIHWSLLERPECEKDPHPMDMVASPRYDKLEFSKILKTWLETNHDRRDSRNRIAENLREEHIFTINRLVSAANAFDILPESAAPKKYDLDPEIAIARDECKKIFNKLKKCAERETILSALGRLGSSALKQKAKHRAGYITKNQEAEKIFPHLEIALEEAINTRNYFVHGSKPKLSTNDTFEQLAFLTNTLEFVHCMSDLAECGLNLDRWCKSSSTMRHMFFSYRNTYQENIKSLISALDKLNKKNDTHSK
jgi:hypothetical protein